MHLLLSYDIDRLTNDPGLNLVDFSPLLEVQNPKISPSSFFQVFMPNSQCNTSCLSRDPIFSVSKLNTLYYIVKIPDHTTEINDADKKLEFHFTQIIQNCYLVTQNGAAPSLTKSKQIFFLKSL